MYLRSISLAHTKWGRFIRFGATAAPLEPNLDWVDADTAVLRGAAGGHVATATEARVGSPEASHALPGVQGYCGTPWGQQGAAWTAVAVILTRVIVDLQVPVHVPSFTSLWWALEGVVVRMCMHKVRLGL